ncbi:MAG: stage II sporulation protein M [Solirubrobacteraceae bacterium]
MARSPGARDLAAGALACAGAATLVIVCGAASVALTGLADDVRRALRFDFAGVDETPAAALQIALHNARLAAAALLCALVVPRLAQRARLLADVVLATVLAANASLVGLALGAYGGRVAAAIALHLPIEFAALSLAGGAYMSTSRRPLGLADLAIVAGLCALMLIIAATLETYVALGGGG